MAHYLDTSGLVKLVVSGPETAALRTWLGNEDRRPVTSELARTELIRAVRRVAPDRAVLARTVLDSVTVLALTADLFEAAGRLEPDLLRSLDAVHLAAALALGDDLESLVTYDDRLAEVARADALPVTVPR